MNHDGHAGGLLPRLWAASFGLPMTDGLRGLAMRVVNDTFVVGALAAIEAPDGRGYLLARHSYPIDGEGEVWGLPGGAVRSCETVRSTVRREVRQETGLEVAVDGVLAIDQSRQSRLDLVFEAWIVGGRFRPSSEVVELGYFPVNALPANTSRHHRTVLERLGHCPTPAFGQQ
jgi:ADP-ribose pyrophosphatase YjhB (NUDIX family)